MIDKSLKQKHGLPVTKDVVYYAPGTDTPIKVKQLRAIKVFDGWSVLELILENGNTVMIHSSFLKEMQTPNYSRNRIQS